MTPDSPQKVAWRAVAKAGVAHCYPRSSLRARALCGVANQSERFDWPKRSRCDVCERMAAA